MGLFKKLRRNRTARIDAAHSKQAIHRRCHFEKMEPRQMLDADPVVAGITYLEDDLGQDVTPDYFEVTFQGGADTTQMTQFVINGDQDLSGGLTTGDMFFDIDDAQPGASQFHAFQFHAGGSRGVTAADVLGVQVSNDGLQLTVNVQNFEAGDKLAFTIDVDEVEKLRSDKIASGVEFEGTFFEATFVDENYNFSSADIQIDTTLQDGQQQTQVEGVFFDEYDALLLEGEDLSTQAIDLVRDNAQGNANRTAAAIDVYHLDPKPIEISGTVYHDEDIDCEQDADEHGIENVTITLQKFNESTGQYDDVATTLTDANGDYSFGKDLGLTPGKFRLIESQPDGYLDVGASAGTVAGLEEGIVSNDKNDRPNVISDIDIPLGGTVAENFDFKEVLPATIAGNVYHDRNNDGMMDPGEEGIANVLIEVTRVGAKDPSIADPFVASEPIFVRTDANGHYEVTGLPPGIYQVTEINNYPPGENPLVDFVDGKDTVGTIGAATVGNKTNDAFNTIELCAGDDGIEYNFGELKPASISGFVSVSTPEGDCLDPSDPNHTGIAGVEIQLFDSTGNLVATTNTDSDGHYEFTGLEIGTYSVVEVQPDGYLDGAESVGQVDGNTVGLSPVNDRFVAIEVGSGEAGSMYNFCEHIPASIKGYVYHDLNNDGEFTGNEDPIPGTVVELYDAQGNLVASTTTDSSGQYCFDDLYAGEYMIVERQPSDFLDGRETLGTVSNVGEGTVEPDKFNNVRLLGGDEGINYNFGEIKPGSISGTVHADANGDCTFEAREGDFPLGGVQLELLDANGKVLEVTKTDADGNYAFLNLVPGEYSVREVQPDGYLNGDAIVGTVNGQHNGTSRNDTLTGIVLASGQSAVNYDFCEHIPAQLKGTVWFDVNNDGVQQGAENGIAGVTIQLFDADGNLVAEQITDAEGNYCFEDLIAGEYKIREIQPGDYVDGKDSLGSVNGLVAGEYGKNDEFCDIIIRGGQTGENYDFGEIRLASIEGFVHIDPNGDCVFDTAGGDEPLAGVTMQLFDGDGNLVKETVTDSKGHYSFGDLLPGTYSIKQVQPGDYFTTGEVIGTGGGDASENLLSNIVIDSGQNLTNYNFCEQEAAEIHGRVWEDGPAFQNEDGILPNNYRNLRDGLYDPNVDQAIAGVRMELWYFTDPDSGDSEPRPVTLGEVIGSHYAHLGNDPNAAVYVETMADGQYWFKGLQAGNYIVLEAQPEGYADSNDAVGSTTGFTYNSEVDASLAPSSVLQIFNSDQVMDSVVNIRVNSGQISVQNNFSEVRVEAVPDTPENPIVPRTPPSFGNPTPPGLPGAPGLGLAGHQSVNTSTYGGGTVTVVDPVAPDPYTWHLSVVNGGLPRGGDADIAQTTAWQSASFLSEQDWNRFDMQAGEWTFTTTQSNGTIEVDSENVFFGMIGGKPLAGDFDGDGDDEVVLYKDGYWVIDLNGNGRWDSEDLIARLGDHEDRPVVGDWDGDGKDDIGIYGPIWEGDHEAIEADPGIPDAANAKASQAKNIPPRVVDAAEGARAMRLSSFGQSRIDVIDHVFGYGEGEDVPVTGDWNGDAIRTIGMFKDGVWQIDSNGDGRFDFEDAEFTFGRAGDIPLVGDFNGDGVEEIAVYRDGTWIIDTNGNHQRDAADKVFEMGGRGDIPVVGDWDGDGVDEPAIYSADSIQANSNIQ